MQLQSEMRRTEEEERREKRSPLSFVLCPLSLILLLGGSIGLAELTLRPDLFFHKGFLIGDASINLHVADRLLDGATLYQEVFYHYGPLPIYLYTFVAWLFGNTMIVYGCLLLVLSLLHVTLVYLLLRRHTSTGTAVVVAVLGVLPHVLLPGSRSVDFTFSPYIPLERCCLTGLALAWSLPHHRTKRRAVVLGLLLGMWQLVKFGGAFFGGAALLLTDLLALALHGQPGLVRRWVGTGLLTLAAFAIVQTLWVIVAFNVLDTGVAWDVVWPVYHLRTYASYANGELRWPTWVDGNFFLQAQLPVLIAAALTLAGLTWWVRQALRRFQETETDPKEDAEGLGLFLPGFFYLLGCAGYFRQALLFRQYAWTLFLPAAWLLPRLPMALRASVAALWGLSLLHAGITLVARPMDPDCVAVDTPNGERLYLERETAAQVRAVLQALDSWKSLPGYSSESAPPQVLFFPLGAGFHHFHDIPWKERTVWFLPGFVRDYDEEKLLRSLEQMRAVVLLIPQEHPEPASIDPQFWLEPVLRRPARDAFAARLGPPQQVAPKCWVFPLVGASSPSERGR
jgi:hypothetical protein